MNWHTKKKEEVIKELNSNLNGLSQAEVEIRSAQHGENIIKETFKVSPVKIFLTQFKSFLIYILLAATLLSFLIKHYLDGSVILVIIIINATIGFIQQYKAEKSILELRKILIPLTRVLREGKLIRISSTQLIPGDILVLSEGDKITADARIIEAESLEVNEAILTGESMPVEKFSDSIKDNVILADRKNMLYTGTTITKGNAKAIVTETGMQTEFGKIASSLQQIQTEQTPMQRRLDKFAKQITLIILGLVLILAAIGIIEGQDKMEMFLTAIALAVSAIPEGLPAIITISLAFATRYMHGHKALIRRLPAAETLGSVTVIASDKTGTITQEKMLVRKIFSNNKFYTYEPGKLLLNNKLIDTKKDFTLSQLFKTTSLASNARFEQNNKRYEIMGDQTESALVLAALELGFSRKNLTEQEPRIKEISFSSERKIMSIIRQGERRKILYAKGASKHVLDLCEAEMLNSKIQPLTKQRKLALLKTAETMEADALRVLGFAFRNLEKQEKNPESGLIFLGFIGMQDSPRPEVKAALQDCINAGIKVKMLTGDSALTAKAIAQQIGMKGKIITGYDLEKISDSELKKNIDDIVIFARINPEQKLRIVNILKSKQEIVAITGDGVNDVLALKKADIGIAMGIRGTDVAREVSDMVLTDDNFASIAKAVEQGRIVHDNTENITKYLLALNLAEIFLIAFTIFARLPLPLLPIHILWINLVTDTIPTLGLIKEKHTDVMKTEPRKNDGLLGGIFLYVLTSSLLLFAVELFFFFFGLNRGYPIVKIRTLVLCSSILFQLCFVSTVRSRKKLTEIGFFSNKTLLYTISAALLLQLAIIYTPLSSIFRLTPLALTDWLLIIPLSLIGLIVFELWKYQKKK